MKLSVLIPTYNYARFLPDAIESVLGQDFTDYELVVVDDCSPDGSRAVGEGYASRDPRVRFIVNERNLGMVENWNRCLGEARGDYVKFLFGDDKLLSPKALSKMVAKLDGDRDVSLVSCARSLIDESSQVTGVWSHFYSGVADGKRIISKCLSYDYNFIGEPTAVMFRKGDAQRGFDSRYRLIVDLEMWFSLLEKGRFAYIDEPLVAFRCHDAQQTGKCNREVRTLDDYDMLHECYLDREYVHVSDMHRWYLHFVNNQRALAQLMRRQIGFAEFVDAVRKRTPLSLFIPQYVLYKLYKKYLKIIHPDKWRAKYRI